MLFNKKRILLFSSLGFIITASTGLWATMDGGSIEQLIENTVAATIGGFIIGVALDLILILVRLIQKYIPRRVLTSAKRREEEMLRSKKLREAGLITEQEYQTREKEFRSSIK